MKKKFIIGIILCLLVVGVSITGIVVCKVNAEENNPTVNDELYIGDESQTVEPVAEEPKENIEWLKNIANWGISAFVSIFGSGIICVIFRKILLRIVEDIKNRKKEAKDESDASLKKIDEALNKLEKEKEDFQKEKESFIQAGLSFYKNSKDAIILLGCGVSELVENGTAEKIKEMLNDDDKEL